MARGLCFEDYDKAVDASHGVDLDVASVGWLAERGWTRMTPSTIAAMLIGEATIYLFELAWLSRFPLTVGVLDVGLLPFVAGDVYKVALAATVLPPITRRFDRLGSRSGA